MSKNTLKQECLVAYYCTLQEMTKANIIYNAREDDFLKRDQIISGVDSFLKTGIDSKKIWKSIEVNTIKLGKSPGQRLEDAISEDPLLTRLGISTQLMSGHTTETWITAFEEERRVNVFIRFQSDSFTMNPETLNE